MFMIVHMHPFKSPKHILTLNAPSRLLFSSAEMFKKVSTVNSVNPDQTAPIGAVCSMSTLFASILNSSVMLGNFCSRRYLQMHFFSWRFKGYCIAFKH